MKRVVEEAARLCADLGHRVVEARPSVDGERFTDAFITLLAAAAARIVSFAKDRGLKPEDVLEPWTIGLAEFYTAKPKGALEAASAYLRDVEAAVGAFMERWRRLVDAGAVEDGARARLAGAYRPVRYPARP